MRLLTYNNEGDLYVTRDLADDDVPPYAILSHTWGADDEEVTFQEIESESYKVKAGYLKIDFCGRQARRDGLNHFWVDTCCIDKTNHVELSEAITSMYRWYRHAQLCYVYLSDVSTGQENHAADAADQQVRRSWKMSFRRSRWFTRGWTLQELLAPKEVGFYSMEGECLGTKSSLKDLLHEITGIPAAALGGCPLSQYTVAERLRWTKGRQTKKKEDQAYCLLGIFNVFMPLNYGEGDHAFIRLTKKINKAPRVTISLRTAAGATFDSYDQAHRGCHPATRLDLLESVRNWAREVSGKSIFWLNGMAGTGKSTISWTIARWLADLGASETVALGASFFFKRGEGDRSSATLLFPTIASQLAAKINDFDLFLAQAIDADPYICSKSLGEQFNKLISEPLQRLGDTLGRTTYVIVVDALDECENETDIRTVLQLWSQLPLINAVSLRLFLTSRPELVIRLGFKRMPLGTHYDLILHEVPELIVQHDIHAFLSDTLAEVREEHNLEIIDEPLRNDWPGHEALQALTTIAAPLFIVAATIRRLICDADHPQQCLDTILSSRNNSHLSETGKIYMLVLNAMTQSLKHNDDVRRVHHDFRVIVGSIITLAEPLSRTALATLLDITSSQIQIRLRPLHAVLEVPLDGDALIRPLHLSLGEYLTSEEVGDTPYWVCTVDVHTLLWRKCLLLLSSPTGLRENVCQLDHPGQFRSEVPAAQVDEKLRPGVRYACRYWVHHFESSESRVHDDDEVYDFLQRHFLHWLEALSFLGRLADAIDFIVILQSALAEEKSSCALAFLEDARRFVLAFRQIGEQAPLQLYCCAATFAPQTSIVRRTCSTPRTWIRRGPTSPVEWGLELERLEGHDTDVNGVAFSPDGSILASAGSDGTLRLWEVRTGRESQRLASWIRIEQKAVAFSPDGLLLASVASDRTARIWEVSTGVQQQTFQTTSVTAVAFAPKGLLLALASWDMQVQLWEASIGQAWQEMKKLETNGRINTVTFSPDGSVLASAGYQQPVQLWEVKTGQVIWELKGHIGWVRAMAFSRHSSLFVSAATDGTIRLWDTESRQEVRRFEAHAVSVAFHPKSALLAAASGNYAQMWLWNTETGQKVQTIDEHDFRLNMVAFSPRGSLLASAATDGVIRLWNVKLGQESQKSKKSGHSITDVLFSLDGLLLAVVTSDEAVRISQVNTGHEVHIFADDAFSIQETIFSPDGRLIAARGNMGLRSCVWIWDVSTGQAVQKLNGIEGANDLTYKTFFSPDSSSLAVASSSASGFGTALIHIWDVSTGQKKQSIRTNDAKPELWTFSPDGSLLASASADNTVWLLVVETGEVMQRIRSDHPIKSLSFSSDNDLLIDDGFLFNPILADEPLHGSNLKVGRDWITCRGVKLLWLPQEYRSRCWSASGTMVAIGRSDGIVSIFDINYPPDGPGAQGADISMTG